MTRILPFLAIALALIAPFSYGSSPVQVSAGVDVDSYSESHPVFRFVVMGDNRPAGGGDPVTQPEVFLGMIEEISLLDPDFVVIVGDLILGGTTDPVLLNREWDAFEEAIEGFTVPVYLLPGNHDTSNQISEDIYVERYGKLYYSFDHKGSHFILLDSDKCGSVNNIVGDQLQWLKADLEQNKNADHIFVLLHKPLWGGEKSNWDLQIHPLLAGYGADVVFAGDVHRYEMSPPKDGVRYIITGGAGAPLRGDELLGGFYHYVFVTVREPDVKLAIVKAGGVKPQDYVNAEHKQNVRSIVDSLCAPLSLSISGDAYRGRVVRRVPNQFDHMIEGTLSWNLSSDVWDVDPDRIEFKLEPGHAGEYAFNLSAQPGAVAGPPEFKATVLIDKARPPLEIAWTPVVAGGSEIYPLDNPVTIDGTLTDWGDSPPTMWINSDANVTDGAESWAGPHDMTAAISLAHRDGDIYIMAKVEDDQLVSGKSGNFRTSDGIAFRFTGNPLDTSRDPNRVEVRPRLEGRETDVGFKGKLAHAMNAIRVATKSGDWGYNVELLIPSDVASQILRASENGSFRFDVHVSDVDVENNRAALSTHTWSRYPVNWRTLETFGEIVIKQHRPPTPSAKGTRSQPRASRQSR